MSRARRYPHDPIRIGQVWQSRRSGVRIVIEAIEPGPNVRIHWVEEIGFKGGVAALENWHYRYALIENR